MSFKNNVIESLLMVADEISQIIYDLSIWLTSFQKQPKKVSSYLEEHQCESCEKWLPIKDFTLPDGELNWDCAFHPFSYTHGWSIKAVGYVCLPCGIRHTLERAKMAYAERIVLRANGIIQERENSTAASLMNRKI